MIAWSMILFALVACVSETDGLNDSAAGRGSADSDFEAGSEGLGSPSLLTWGYGSVSCNWLYTAGPVDAHSMFVADLRLPEADFDAGVDVSYDRRLELGELVVWSDDAAEESESVFLCNDDVPTIVGRPIRVTAGRIVIDARATGPDEVCGSPQTYAVTWTFSELESADGALADIGPLQGVAGYFQACYG